VGSPHLVDFVLGLMLLEALALGVYWSRTGAGIAPRDLAPNLLAGGFLLLAVRAALTAAPRPWLLICLTAALAAHLADVARRWRKR
jgi:hypothetical protein